MKAFQKLWKMILFPQKSSFHSWDTEYFVTFFLSFSQFPDSKGQTKKGIFLNIFCKSKRDWKLVPGLLGYLTKLRRIMGLVFSADFLHTLSMKMPLIK